MSDAKKSAGRRTFLVGLLTGAGAVAALSTAPQPATAKKDQGTETADNEPVLYRRTAEAERYYRSLYRA